MNKDVLSKFIKAQIENQKPVVSTEGYRDDSPDKNEKQLIIPSPNISMRNNDGTPLSRFIKGRDNLGNEIVMQPGRDYTFPGDYVVETPMAQDGGWLDTYQKGREVIPPMFRKYIPEQPTTRQMTFAEYKQQLPDNFDTNPKSQLYFKEPTMVRDNTIQVNPTPPHKTIIPYDPMYKFNPKNWGVTDYTDKGSRGAAFAAARKNGEKEFMWNNQRFNTKSDMSPEQQLKVYGITDKQIGTTRIGKNLADNLYPAGYSTSDNTSINKSKISSYLAILKRVYDAGILNKIEPDRFDADDAINFPEDSPDFKGIIEQRYKDRIDYNNLYFGLPQKYNTKRISKYKPSNSKDNNSVEYYTSDLIQQRLNGLLAFNDLEFKRSVQPGDNSNTGSYTLDSGEDDRGKYYSFYDKWDLSPFGTGKDESLGIGKPIEIYDRIYYKDYGDGNNKRMYYTDKELSQLDINKKDFDTLALQRELSNRGYKLPKSTKKDGSFDGIWGDETKNALLDYQIKNKTK